MALVIGGRSSQWCCVCVGECLAYAREVEDGEDTTEVGSARLDLFL